MSACKTCEPPKGGGSARSGVRYILGYAVGVKHGDPEEQNKTYEALMDEAREREDYGVGTIWKPGVGDGKRPSAIYARGVVSLATADLEMEAWKSANGQVTNAVHHDVYSVNEAESLTLTDEDLIGAALRMYEVADLGDCPLIMSVHRDTDNAHVHVIRAAVNPITLRAYDMTQIHTRLDRGCRTAEMERGMEYNHGLVVVRKDANGTEYLNNSTYEERKTWKRENRAQRLADLERRRYEDVAAREGTFARYAEASVEPRIRTTLRTSFEARDAPLAIDAMNAAMRRGTRIEIIGAGDAARAYLRDVSTARFRAKQAEDLAAYAVRLDHDVEARTINAETREENIQIAKEVYAERLEAEYARVYQEGELVALSPATILALGDLEQYRDEERAERAFVGALEADPGRVARALTRSDSVFSRDDLERYVAARVTDVGEVERMVEHVVNRDANLVLMSPDVADGVYTTHEMLTVERQIADDARLLATTRDPRFDAAALSRAIATMEDEHTATLRASGALRAGERFTLSGEQRALLNHLDKRLVVGRGVSGSGKTTVMEATRRYAEATGREIVGLTLSQGAAIKLERAAGFRSVNTALAFALEKHEAEIIPRNGIVVLDEAGMIDSRTMQRLIALVRERNAQLVPIGDDRQLSAIGAGGSFRILQAVATGTDTFSELKEIRRQKNAWHRDAVYAMSDGIGTKSELRIADAVQLWERNGALRLADSHDAAISDAVAWYQAQRARSDDVLLVASDKDSVRYLNEEIRRRDGRDGRGHTYATDGGARQITEGDRFIFGENNRKLGVVNGDTGTVVAHGQYCVQVKLDRTTDTVQFDTRRYDKWDHGYATTVHRAQGASVRACGGVLDRSATAELAHVASSRSTEEYACFASRHAFADARDLAEHLAANIMDKGTTQDISTQLAARGGPDSFFAQNVRAQAASALNPDVIAYERAQAERALLLRNELTTISEEYRSQRAVTSREEWREINRAQRDAEKRAVAEFGPEHKADWLGEHRAERNIDADLVAEAMRIRRQREQRRAVPTRATAEPRVAPVAATPMPAPILRTGDEYERLRVPPTPLPTPEPESTQEPSVVLGQLPVEVAGRVRRILAQQSKGWTSWADVHASMQADGLVLAVAESGEGGVVRDAATPSQRANIPSLARMVELFGPYEDPPIPTLQKVDAPKMRGPSV
ncbi:MAG: AAA family ATPase [Vulcanimicrobiaceae bacterium]